MVLNILHVGKNMIPVVILILIGIFLLKPSLQVEEPLQRDLPICFLNLGQTVEKHEEEHILTVEDHQEEKQRARRQKRVPEHYRLLIKSQW